MAALVPACGGAVFTTAADAGDDGPTTGDATTQDANAPDVPTVPDTGVPGDATNDAATADSGMHDARTEDAPRDACTSVNCAGPYSVGGTVSGLNKGSSVVLQDNGTYDVVVSANGPFAFPMKFPDHSAYDVKVVGQPMMPGAPFPEVTESCAVTAGIGTVNGADVSSIQVACTPTASQLYLDSGGLTTQFTFPPVRAGTGEGTGLTLYCVGGSDCVGIKYTRPFTPPFGLATVTTSPYCPAPPYTLPYGSSCIFNPTFAPLVAGTYQSTMTIAFLSNGMMQTQTITVTGTAM
jgi:hypothetical protein